MVLFATVRILQTKVHRQKLELCHILNKIQLKNNRGLKPKVLSEEQEKWIIDFLERPEMTYTNPGRKDHVYIGKINGEKQFVQKKPSLVLK